MSGAHRVATAPTVDGLVATIVALCRDARRLTPIAVVRAVGSEVLAITSLVCHTEGLEAPEWSAAIIVHVARSGGRLAVLIGEEVDDGGVCQGQAADQADEDGFGVHLSLG
jgi:hypothetical protein